MLELGLSDEAMAMVSDQERKELFDSVKYGRLSANEAELLLKQRGSQPFEIAARPFRI